MMSQLPSAMLGRGRLPVLLASQRLLLRRIASTPYSRNAQSDQKKQPIRRSRRPTGTGQWERKPLPRGFEHFFNIEERKSVEDESVKAFKNFEEGSHRQASSKSPSETQKHNTEDTQAEKKHPHHDNESGGQKEWWKNMPYRRDEMNILLLIALLVALDYALSPDPVPEITMEDLRHLIICDEVQSIVVDQDGRVNVYLYANPSMYTDGSEMLPLKTRGEPPAVSAPRHDDFSFSDPMVQQHEAVTEVPDHVASCSRLRKLGTRFRFSVGSVPALEQILTEMQLDLGIPVEDHVPVGYRERSVLASALWQTAPSLLLVAAALLMMRDVQNNLKMGGPGGRGNIFQVGKAKPVKYSKDSGTKINFDSVAGLDEAKQEIMEFVHFLRHPQKYTRMGAKIPTGALLVGPPGTGKTLLAKAVAGEANVPFYSMSGSDFIEMFVGVGPSRVRDLFSQARSSAPCIVFIDEIDAVGRARGRGGFAGGNDERENTLNQLLVEMDGFKENEGVVVLAGTNRADILDKALLRPGRFDRQISVDIPDMSGRKAIFDIHLKSITIAEDKEKLSKRLATLTPGMSGADIANVCNEAALYAARRKKDAVDMADFDSAIDRIVGGIEKPTKVISKEEKRKLAYHEAGHAVCGWFLKHVNPVMKVSIIPRGSNALGFTQSIPTESFLSTEMKLRDTMVMALGGRVAEEIVFGSVTSGASDDLKKVTDLAQKQVAMLGMNPKVGKVSYLDPSESKDMRIHKPFSETTARLIDQEVSVLVAQAHKRARDILEMHRDVFTELAERLLAKEVLTEKDLEEVLGPRPFGNHNQHLVDYDAYMEAAKRARGQAAASFPSPSTPPRASGASGGSGSNPGSENGIPQPT